MENEHAKKWLAFKLVEEWSKGFDQGADSAFEAIVKSLDAFPPNITFTKGDLANYLTRARVALAQMKTHIPPGYVMTVSTVNEADGISDSRAKPMPGIPAEVACPWCGGYVRGHQWIGAGDCSIITTKRDF